MSRLYVLFAVLSLTACGDDGGNTPADARQSDTTLPDAMGDGCDYTEQNDLTNDTTEGGTTETTGIDFSTSAVLCGVLDHTHFDEDYLIVDVDSFTLTVAEDTDLIVRMTATGGNAIEFIGADVRDVSDVFRGGLTYYGNHGVVSARVPAGTFEIQPFALAAVQQTMSVPYRIEILRDTPDTRCLEVTSGGYTEKNDGANNSDNDVYAYPVGQPVAFTAAANDAPEPTNIVIAPGTSIRFAGQAADIAQVDKYEDTDTYEIATTFGTNELTIRMTWPESGANLDWILYEENSLNAIARGMSTSTTGELQLAAVKPSTTYWLAVSAVAGTTVPATYNATLCGGQYTP